MLDANEIHVSDLLFLFSLAIAYRELKLQVAMKLAPDRKKFLDVVGGTGDINSDIDKFCTTFAPFLEENHKFLVRSLAVL